MGGTRGDWHKRELRLESMGEHRLLPCDRENKNGQAAKVSPLERLIVWSSQPASQISGHIISIFGLMLVVATLVLGIIHMLGTVDFVATMSAGTVLSSAGIWAITTNYIRALDAAKKAG